MAYLGLNPNTPLLNTSTQTLSGNSAATEFTLSRAVASASDLDVMIGNVMQRPFTDYTAGNTTLLFASPPATGSQNITVTYRGGALNSLDLTASVFNTGTEGNPSVYSLAGDSTGIYWPSSTSVAVTISGSNRTVFNANATSVSSTTGALVVQGGAGFGGNVYTSGNLVITDTSESTSVYTGALRVGGGAGIVGNLNIGGDITCVGDFTVNGIFTTTGTDSLEVNDPFIFLANANPGDTYDSGVVTQYYDGTNTRYSGYFRDITDNKYKLFGNLLPKPSTTVDTANASFQYQDLVLANLSATGTVNGSYFIGNGALLTGISTDTTQITNGTSKVVIPSLNGSILNNVNGVTIETISSTGVAVTGNISATTAITATGNITGGNLTTAGITSSTGNIISAANVSGGNLITGGQVISTGNIAGGNINTAGRVSAGGNVDASNLKTAGIVSAVGDVYGNNFSATTAITAGTSVAATTDVTAGGLVSATGAVNAGTTMSAAGNIDGGNLRTSGTLSVAGNILSAINTTANITTSGNISGGNISTSALLQGGTLSATGIVTFSGTTNAISIGTSQTTGTTTVGGTAQTGFISVGRSTVSQALYIANGVMASGNTKTLSIGENGAAGSTTTIAIGPATGAGTTTFNAGGTVAIANTSGTALSVAGNITGGNLSTAGSGGNITGANVVSATTFNGTTVSVTGNVTGGNIITGGALSVTGAISSTGNVTGGNLITNGAISAGGLISATGNVTGGNINTSGLVSSTGNITNGIANVLTGNAIVTSLVQAATLSATGNVIGGNLNATGLSLSGNVVSGLSMITDITTTANVNGGNLLASGIISSAGNVTSAANVSGGYILGNIAFTTGGAQSHVHTGILSGTSLVNIPVASGNIIANVGGATIETWASTGVYVTGLVSATGNIIGGNINGGANVNATTLTGTTVSVTGNIDSGNLRTAGLISATGGVTAASVTVSTGTVTLGNIVNGNGNGVGNIGSSTTYFNTVFGKATTAQYADLAENYVADAEYAPGTVLDFGGTNEVTLSTVSNSSRVAGVVSTNPAHLMNGMLKADHIAPVALTGRVPTSVVGTVRKGDMMVSAGNGQAQACATPSLGTVIGKAIEDFDGESGVIEIVVGRL